MRVAELMQTDVKSIAPDASIAELVGSLAETRVSGLPVVNTEGHVVGVVSAGDVLRAAAKQDDGEARAALFQQVRVRDIMTPNPHVIEPDADSREAAKHMLYADVRRLFVEERGKLVGVISQTDIAHAVGTGRL
jgi:CBS domain-containing protein